MPSKDKEAQKKYMKEWRSKNEHQQRDYRLRRKYGITTEQVKQMYTDQCGHCLICENQIEIYDAKGTNTVIDHCHEYGHVRGILCRKCNLVLGNIENRHIDIENRIEYIRRIQEYLIYHHERGNNNTATAGDRDEMSDLPGASEEGA
jgi:hypothetical protein